jgi:hypothetical protein
MSAPAPSSAPARKHPAWCLPETYDKWQRLQAGLERAQKDNLRKPELIPRFAWYVAYAEQSFRQDQEFNDGLRRVKEETLRRNKKLVRALLQKSKPVYKALVPLIDYLENPTAGTTHQRAALRVWAAEAKAMLKRHKNVEIEWQRLTGDGPDYPKPELASWEDPNQGQTNTNQHQRRILVTIQQRTLGWWDRYIGPEYAGGGRRDGKVADMLVLAEVFGVLETKCVSYEGERVLRKLIRDGIKATSNLNAPPPPKN